MMPEKRPPRAYVTGDLTRAGRVASWVPVAAAVWLLASGYPALPDVVPTHWALDGTPDGWGPKTGAVLFLAAFLAAQVGVDLLSRRPALLNYPARVTPANAQRLYREGERTLVAVEWALALVVLATPLQVAGARWATHLQQAGLGLVVVAVAVGVARMVRAGRQETTSPDPTAPPGSPGSERLR